MLMILLGKCQMNNITRILVLLLLNEEEEEE